MMAGNLIIDSTCVAGSIQLLGVGYIEADNSGGGCSVDQEGFLSVQNVSFGVWEETVDDHGAAGTTGKKLKDISSGVILTGTAVGPGIGSNQIKLPAAASSVDGAYDPAMIVIVAGTGAGQCRGIYQYKGGTDRIATVDRNWKVLPDASSEFVITAWPGREHVNEGLADGGTTDTITLNPLASGDDDVYIGQSVFIRSGLGEDQVATITAYNGTSKIATITPDWTVVPDTTSGYVMLPFRYLTAAQTTEAIWNALKASYNVADTFGEAVNNLPDDPADQSLIEAAITASEVAIRGTDSDDLKVLSDQLDAVQLDLDDPAQYKADVTLLALEATAQLIKDKTDNLPTDPADQSAVEAAITTSETAIRGTDSDDLKVLSDQLDLVAPAGEYDTELAAIQADLDDPDQYKADVTAVALEATLQLVKTETDKIPSIEVLLAFIQDIEGGRWRIENNQMIFYKADNTTEVARFNLFDEGGAPAEEDVFERQRV